MSYAQVQLGIITIKFMYFIFEKKKKVNNVFLKRLNQVHGVHRWSRGGGGCQGGP